MEARGWLAPYRGLVESGSVTNPAHSPSSKRPVQSGAQTGSAQQEQPAHQAKLTHRTYSTHPAQQEQPADTAANQRTIDGMLQEAFTSLRALDRDLLPLTQAFNEAGHSLYLVGGSVRDALLGRLSHDLDFTTDARPQAIVDIVTPRAETVWDTGIEYGTVSALVKGQILEITTFRADQYDGQSRNPEVSFGDSLDGDLIRRDFRANAIALELSPDGNHQLRDPLNGLEDLQAGVLDTPDSPEISFNDDPLRMLRACRFVSQLEFGVTKRVQQAMTAMSEQINRITVERVAVELNKLMLGAAPWVGLDLMVETGLADHVLPELPALKLTQDEHRQHKDVYWHSLKVLRNAVNLEAERGLEPSLELRMAALLHDIGKPDTRAFTESGAVTFHQHEVVGARITRRRLRKLKYSKQHVQDIGQLVFLHMRFHGYADNQGKGQNQDAPRGAGEKDNNESTWTDSAVRRYVNDAGELLPLLHLLVRADCTTRNQRKAQRLQRTYDNLEKRIEQLQEQEDLAAVRPDLDGNEIMQILNLKPGPDVGKAWAYLKELRLDRGPMDHDDAVAALQEWWAAQND